MPRHLLTDKDPASGSASCSVCGPVAIVPNGGGKWLCANKRRKVSESWRRQNPERVAASRNTKSAHHLTKVNGDYVCPIDGIVSVVAIGRGWMCGVRAAELGRSTGTEPTPKCSLCGFFATVARPVGEDGMCTLCRGDEREAVLQRAVYLSAADVDRMSQHVEMALSDDGLGEPLPEVRDGWSAFTEDFDAYETDGWNYSKPSMKTIGPPIPKDSPWYRDMQDQKKLARQANERRYG